MPSKQKKRKRRRVPRIPIALNQHAHREQSAGKRAYKRKQRCTDADDG
jgi:hypothetical protein